MTELLPEVDSVSPIVLITGDPPLTFFVRGRNLQNASAIRFVPANGIVVGSNLNVNAAVRKPPFRSRSRRPHRSVIASQ